jgi:hypothetical protein
MNQGVKHIFISITTILLLVVLWGIFTIINFKDDMQKPTELAYSVPKNALLHVQLHPQEVGMELLKAIVFDDSNDALVKQLKDKFKSSDEQKEVGINWLQDVHYFKVQLKNGHVQGIIATILNTIKWDSNITTFLGNVSVAKRQGNSGIVVQSSELSKEDLYAFIQQLQTPMVSHSDKHSLVQFSANTKNINYTGFVDQVGEKILSKGVAQIPSAIENYEMEFFLQPTDFHFSTSLISTELSRELENLIGTSLPLTGISMNYRGVSIDVSKGQQLILPDADILMQFKESNQLDQFLKLLPFEYTRKGQSQLEIFGVSYYCYQISPQMIYFGKSKEVALRTPPTATRLQILGEPSHLFEIQGSPLVKAVLKMNTIVSIGSDLSQQLAFIKADVKELSNQKMDVDLQFQFKENKLALLQLMSVLGNRF